MLDPPSFAPTNRNSSIGLVSKWLASRIRSGRSPGSVAVMLAIFTRPTGVVASKACSLAL